MQHDKCRDGYRMKVINKLNWNEMSKDNKKDVHIRRESMHEVIW